MPSRFVFEGERLREVRFPMGGIGAGCVSLDGGARFVDWEIQNRPNKNSRNGWTHVAVKAERDGALLAARALHGPLRASFMGQGEGRFDGYGFGPSRNTLAGVPHFHDVRLAARFPAARWDFSGDFPAEVSLSAFSPFEPHNEPDSSLPLGMMAVSLTNTTDAPIRYSAAFTLGNPHAKLPVNRVERREGVTSLVCGARTDTASPAWGEVCVSTDADCVSAQQNWYRSGWFDDLSTFWHDFARPGPLPSRALPPVEDFGAESGTLCVSVDCRPGETAVIRFALSWYWPNFEKYWKVHDTDHLGGWPRVWKNWYATRFESAGAVGRYALSDWDRLHAETMAFDRALSETTIPEEALDAAVNTLSVLKSQTCLRLEDGSFYGWEGCHAREGSCEGSCSHVWNYQYALPFLFPGFERSMRELDYRHNLEENGGMSFRLQLPLSAPRWSFRPCADGQLGGVIKTYRDWKLSGDTGWLEALWPKVRRSLEYAWSPENPDLWDPERTGVLHGRQHHTLDMELFGPNAWLTGIYLAALDAAARMADAVSDTAFAAMCREMAQRGKQWVDQNLWNGEYFCQSVDIADPSVLRQFQAQATLTKQTVTDAYWNAERGEIKYQIGEGCAIDQMLGQWHAELCGLSDVFDRDKITAALASIYRYNHTKHIGDTMNPCRLFCLEDEAGTVICAYPPGRYRPAIPTPYAEETMHGFEYAAAGQMLLHGMEREALDCIRAVRDRYDGRLRNPFNEMECGSNYARSMSAWSLINIYLGLSYDMTRGFIGLSPIRPGDFSSVWSLGGAWGVVRFDAQGCAFDVKGGGIGLSRLGIPRGGEVRAVAKNGQPARFAIEGGEVSFAAPVTLAGGDSLTLAYHH